MSSVRLAFALVAFGVPSATFGQAVETLPPIAVTTPKPLAAPAAPRTKRAPKAADGGTAPAPASTSIEDLSPSAIDFGVARSAGQGFVSAGDLAARPLYRTGEVLEAVPGLVVTQHSGEGKANQYFLRGFNLDHGSDLAISFDGMPVNMRTHAHGQGYADTNFIIPEILQGLAYRKGPYFASDGDFSSAGAIHLDAHQALPQNFGQLELGSFGHRRAVAAVSAPVGNTARVLVAGEAVMFDGPWERSDDLRKLNGFLRFSNGSRDNGFAVTAMAYSGHWFATDQIPQRAVDQGVVGRFGTLDPTDGGRAERFSLSARWAERTEEATSRVSAYLIKSDLRLFNNFTYFLDQPVLGDQFAQVDRRFIAGGAASRTYFGDLSGLRSELTFGVQSRYDGIGTGLYKTVQRATLATVREDDVSQLSIGGFAEHGLRWTSWLRTSLGARADLYSAAVRSTLAANSGSDLDGIVSPKVSVVLGPWSRTELYFNAGSGFHSNDARGTTTTIDPASGQPVPRTPFLVRSRGADLGLRTKPTKDITSTLSAFVLDFESEIVFVGDAGTTEASRPSRRLGLEYSFHARLLPWLFLDLDAAYTHARFTQDDPAAPGRFIPGATEGVASAGLSFDDIWGGWFGGVKVRYFGPRPLVEDNSVRSGVRAPVSARLGYAFSDGLSVRVDAYNIFNERSHQIDYYYASQLSGEVAPMGDVHFHPTEPRSFRLVVRKQF